MKKIEWSEKSNPYQEVIDILTVWSMNHHFEDMIVCLKLYDQENDTLKTLKLIKEKYKYILSRLKKYLVQNCEDYEGYYNEWKTKNPNFVVKNYELKDLLQDLEKLVPKEEKIKISGRDRRNFNLILYLFQTDYFLKDYI